jgi:hypothetical protein
MKKNSTNQKVRSNNELRRGFILPFTMLITVLVLFITTSALALLSKQQYFSKIYKQTQAAYFAADDAITCALSLDDAYVSDDGLGIFPSSSTTPTNPDTYLDNVIQYVNTQRIALDPLAPVLTRSNITCGQSQIFAAGGSPSFDPGYRVSNYNFIYHFINPNTNQPDQEHGVAVSYNMKMDLGLDPADVAHIKHAYRCAKVTINKTASFRQVIAQGYSSCDGTGNSVERAVVNTTLIQ